MIFIRQINRYFLALLPMILLIGCSKFDKNVLDAMINECSMVYKLSDTTEVINHYKKLTNADTNVVSYKHYLMHGGYRLLSLHENNGIYQLTISTIPLPNSTITKTIDSELGKSIFSSVDPSVTFTAPNSPGKLSNLECAIVAIKKDSNQQIGYLYNPNISNQQSTNKVEKAYGQLNQLMKKHFPDYEKAVTADDLKKITIGDKVFYEDQYRPPTKEESRDFLKRFKQDPFFELSSASPSGTKDIY